MNKNIVNSGFTLVEILISLGLMAIFIPAIGLIYYLSLISSTQGEKYTKAYTLAQEGMEEIFLQKNSWDWTNEPLNSYSQITIPPFIRTIEIQEIQRCNLVDICPIGIIDQTSRMVNVKVSWLENNTNQEVNLKAYVTQH